MVLFNSSLHLLVKLLLKSLQTKNLCNENYRVRYILKVKHDKQTVNVKISQLHKHKLHSAELQITCEISTSWPPPCASCKLD